MELPDELRASLDGFEAALEQVETALAPLLKTDVNDFLATAPPAERARVEVTAAYTLTSLFYSTHAVAATKSKLRVAGLTCSESNAVVVAGRPTVYLKIQGVSPNDHPVKKEIERLALYIRKLQHHKLLVDNGACHAGTKGHRALRTDMGQGLGNGPQCTPPTARGRCGW